MFVFSLLPCSKAFREASGASLPDSSLRPWVTGESWRPPLRGSVPWRTLPGLELWLEVCLPYRRFPGTVSHPLSSVISEEKQSQSLLRDAAFEFQPDGGLHCLESVELSRTQTLPFIEFGFSLFHRFLQCSGSFSAVCVSRPSLHKAPAQCTSGLWVLLVVAAMLSIFEKTISLLTVLDLSCSTRNLSFRACELFVVAWDV